VPVIDQGSLYAEINEDTSVLDLYSPVNFAVETLRESGSIAAPGFDRPEGVVVFHTSGRVMFKFVLEATEPEAPADPFAALKALPHSPAMTREEQDAELTRLEQAAYGEKTYTARAEFDIEQAYADAVSKAVEASREK